MAESVALVIVGVVFVFAVSALAYSGYLRGGRRLSWRSIGIWAALPSAITAAVLSLSGNSSTPTFLGVVGVLASFVFGFAGNQLTAEHIGGRLRVGVAIASKSAFHQEIRKALYNSLQMRGCHIRDDGADPDFGHENLIGFERIVSRARADKADFLVIWAPGQAAADSEEVIMAVEDLYRRGGLCIFLETAPSSPELAGKFAFIRHNAERSAELLVDAVRRLRAPDGRVLLLLGPGFSAPALRRRAVLEAGLPASETCLHLALDTWIPQEAVAVTRACVLHGERPDIVVCPNDSIALALVDEMHERRDMAVLKRARIVGFDGLLRAYACIAEPSSPFSLTVAIPPGEFGTCAANVITTSARVSLSPARRRQRFAMEKVMDMDSRNVIDQPRARRRLYDVDG